MSAAKSVSGHYSAECVATGSIAQEGGGHALLKHVGLHNPPVTWTVHVSWLVPVALKSRVLPNIASGLDQLVKQT